METNKKLKVLNLYAGIGGNRKLWKDIDVTAVENNPEIARIYQDFFPEDKVIVGEAIDYLKKNYKKFDFIWSSPPCQSHSRIGFISMKTRERFNEGLLPNKSRSKEIILPDLTLYSQIIFLQHFCKDKFWVVENVCPYYKPLIEPQIKFDRHLFWSNFFIKSKKFIKPEVKHNKVTGKTERFGISLEGIKMKHRKDQIIRNCVNPELGLHILNCALNKEEVKQEFMQSESQHSSQS